MTNIEVHIDPEDLDKKVTEKYKNFNKVDKKLNRFYTIAGMRNLFKRNKLLFIILFIGWLATFVWLIAD